MRSFICFLFCVCFSCGMFSTASGAEFMGPPAPSKTEIIYSLKDSLQAKNYSNLMYGKYTKIEKDRVRMLPGKHPHTFIVSFPDIQLTSDYEVYIYMEPRYDNKNKFSGNIDIANCSIGWSKHPFNKIYERIRFNQKNGKLFASFTDINDPEYDAVIQCEGPLKITIAINPGSDVFEIQELIILKK